MKNPSITLIAACLMSLGFGLAPTLKAIPPDLCIISPDHPSTWYVGFNDKVGQELTWDEKDHALVAIVSYSKTFFVQTDDDPSNDYHRFHLTFPNVALDPKENLFVLNSDHKKVIIGHLERGILSTQVILDKHLSLSAHRKNGRMVGMLVAKGASE